MTTVRDTVEERPGKRSLWRNRDYVLLWCGQAISTIGSGVSDLAFPLLVLATTGSPAQAGLVAALNALAGALVILPAGVLVDRWDRKRVMLFCDILRFMSLASIPLALATGHLTVYQLYITSLIEGTLARFFELAHTASVAQVVEDAQLSTAVALDEVMEGTTALGGPSLAGLLFGLSRALPFLADAISYAVSILTLVMIRAPFQGERKLEQRHLLREARVGMGWLWQQPFLRAMTLLMASSAFFISGETLVVIVLAQQRGASPFIIGCIFGLGGIGSIVGASLASPIGKRLSVGQSVLLCRWLFALLWPLYVLMPVPWMMGLVDFGIGFSDPIEDVAYFSYRLKLIPEELRGRVLSACRLFPGVARPAGLFVTGLLLQTIGAVPTLLISWVALLLIALVITCNRQIRQAGRAEDGSSVIL
jgi:MFS family permease